MTDFLPSSNQEERCHSKTPAHATSRFRFLVEKEKTVSPLKTDSFELLEQPNNTNNNNNNTKIYNAHNPM